MSATDRASNSLRNARYATLFYMVGLVAAFFFRRYFIQVLGDELLGLNSTLVSILGFLNIAELGLSSAVAFALYQPLAQNDQQQVSEIISIQAWFYRWVARIVLVASGILLLFFPLIFKDKGIPLWYAYATYVVLLFNALWGYLFNFRQIIFSSDQQEYKMTLAIQLPRVLKQVLQILAILYLPAPYIWWLGIEFLFGVVGALFIEWLIHQDYPWLKANAKQGNRVRSNYPEIIRRTKQLFYHKIATFVLQQSTPIVIFAVFASAQGLAVVTIYQNYLVIYAGISGVIYAIFNGLTASVGNLITEGDNNRVEVVFRKLYALRLWMALVIAGGMLWYSQGFMELWIGGGRSFQQIDLLLFVLYMLLQLSRLPDQFIYAYGMYQDIYAPMIEAILNLGLSILLGSMWGITGILLGINISLIVVIYGWKPYFLYSRAFKKSVWGYHLRQGAELLLVVGAGWALSYFLPSLTSFASTPSWLGWLKTALSGTCLFALISSILLYLLHPDFRQGFSMLISKIHRKHT